MHGSDAIETEVAIKWLARRASPPPTLSFFLHHTTDSTSSIQPSPTTTFAFSITLLPFPTTFSVMSSRVMKPLKAQPKPNEAPYTVRRASLRIRGFE